MNKPRRSKPEPASDPFETSKSDLSLKKSTSREDDLLLDEEDRLPPAPSAAKAADPVENEEFDESPAPRRRNEELPSVQKAPSEKLDKIGKIAALILVPLIFVGIIYTILKKQPVSEVTSVKHKPSLPIEGKLIKIEDITTGWRDRTEDERVSAEAQLITKATVYPNKLPELRLKFTPTSANSFLRILFYNSDGKIAGDPRVIKVVNGKVQATGQGDRVIGDKECAVAASTGLQTNMHLRDYFAGDQRRWSVEISESNDYQAKGDEWKLLDTFAIADTQL